MWEGMEDNFIPDLHRLVFGFPMPEDVKHLSPLRRGGGVGILEKVTVILLDFLLRITFPYSFLVI